MVNWLSFSQMSGSGDTDVTVTASSYSDLVERTTNLQLSGVSKSVIIPVTQYGIYNPHPEDYYSNYLTFQILTGGTIVWCCQEGNSEYQKTVEYRINGGNWISITSKQPTGPSSAKTIDASCVFNVSSGDVIEWRGYNTTYAKDDGYYYCCCFKGRNEDNGYGGTAKYNVYGNIMSLVYGDNFLNNNVLPTSYTFSSLFVASNAVACENLVLPATSLTKACYCWMFQGSNSLLTAPELPATELHDMCYNMMFAFCDSLVIPPTVLPATSIVLRNGVYPSYCYSAMFENCFSLTRIPDIKLKRSVGRYTLSNMFVGCTSLTKVYLAFDYRPDYEHAYIGNNGAYHMFDGCSNLSEITCLARPSFTYWTSVSRDWVNGVSATGVFYKNSKSTWTRGSDGIPEGWTVIDVDVEW